jgi:Mg-chelatase subunit ChlD
MTRRRACGALLLFFGLSACNRSPDGGRGATPSSAAQGQAPAQDRQSTTAAPAQSSPPSPPQSPEGSPPARPPHTDNLVALEMGGRIESRLRLLAGEYFATKLLDGDPRTLWMASGRLPHEIVLSFLGRDTALVSGVTLAFPPSANDPIWGEPNSLMWPKDVEIWTSMESATAGFHKVVASALPKEQGDHAVPFPAPVEARYVKLVITSNNGSGWSTMLADVAVREGQAAGYVPLLQRHADLRSLFSTGALPPPGDERRPAAVTAAVGTQGDVCAPPARPDIPSTHAESRNVLIVGTEPEWYAPYFYSIFLPDSPPSRYFPAGPGDGRVDSSIFRRATYWSVPPHAADPAALLPSWGVDTVVLSQICNIKTSVSATFKRAIVDWVAGGHKLIIQDSDKCGPQNVPDYAFLPFSFATNNPGAQGASSQLNIVENNLLVSPDANDPAFLDEESWRLMKNGNRNNDFGDSNTVVKFDPHWCGMLVGTNVTGGHGFVATYAHHGRGLILYDGVDYDQMGNVAYRQYVGRQLLLPFDPDRLPCSTRLAPFVVTTDSSLISRSVVPGQSYSYPLSILAVQPGYKGSVHLSLSSSPDVDGLVSRIEPDTVSLGNDAKANLTLTMPQRLPDTVRMALRGVAADSNATLCLAVSERRTGMLTVTSELGQAAAPSRKNLLIVLDLSGSMNLPLGKSTRIATAQQVLRDVLKRIPNDFNVGLRLYGHRYASRQKETCTDSELVVPVRPLDRDLISKTVGRLRPRGETPLVYSVLQAATDLKSAGGGSVVLITDGEESCGGNFAAATDALKQSGLDLRLSIVGFTLTNQKARQELGTMATSTGGSYYSAQDGDALTRALVAATISRFAYSVMTAAGTIVARGEAGDKGHELPAGEYKVVVQAGDEALTIERLWIAPARDATVRVVRKGDRFALDRQ